VVESYAKPFDGTPYAMRRLDAAEFERISPAIAPGPLSYAYFSRSDGHVDPVWVTYKFLDEARRLGAQVLYPCEVQGLELRGPRLAGVSTTQGKFALDRLVVACGTQTPGVLDKVGYSLPMQHAPGILVHSVPIPEISKIAYDGPGDLEFKQMANGRIVGTDAGSPPNIPGHAGILSQQMDFPSDAMKIAHGERILANISKFMPGVKRATFDRLTLGYRPMPKDGFPAVGAVPGVKGVYVATMHSGVTLAPIIGRYVTQELITGTPVPLLAPYRPERFLNHG
jgi:glycine/D-amino acid oxidase-like deaminating enzyme